MAIDAQETRANTDIMVTTIAMSNTLSFVSDPRVSCVFPETMKHWQTNLLACKKCKNRINIGEIFKLFIIPDRIHF